MLTLGSLFDGAGACPLAVYRGTELMDISLILFKGLLTFFTYYILGRLYIAVKHRNQ